jgi:C1A family cysteine protease
MDEYRWGFGVEDLALTIGHHGPCVIGINWYEDMFNPNGDGLIKPGGKLAGGHAILVFGYSDRHRLFRLRNSWGEGWGVGGNCFLAYEDMDRLLHEDGEVCAPVHRIKREQPEVAE